MVKGHPAYDNLPAKQSRWRYLFVTPATSGRVSTAVRQPPATSRASAIPARRQLTFSSKRTKQTTDLTPCITTAVTASVATRGFSEPADFFQNDRIPTSWPNLAHPINHTLRGARHRPVSFRQKFGENWKVLHWVLLGFQVGLNINNVGRWMFGKISLEGGPGAGQDPAASIKTRDRSAENITREGKRCDVTTSGTSVSV